MDAHWGKGSSGLTRTLRGHFHLLNLDDALTEERGHYPKQLNRFLSALFSTSN